MKFVSLDTVSFIVSCWLSVSSKSNASGDGTQTFTVPGSALRCKANLQYIAFMNFQEQIQFTLKQLEHCTATHVHIANERAIQAVWLHIQLYNLGISVQFQYFQKHQPKLYFTCM